MSHGGAILVELIAMVGLLVVLVFTFHLSVIRASMAKLNALQSERLPYDGVIFWKD